MTIYSEYALRAGEAHVSLSALDTFDLLRFSTIFDESRSLPLKFRVCPKNLKAAYRSRNLQFNQRSLFAKKQFAY